LTWFEPAFMFSRFRCLSNGCLQFKH